MHTRFSFPRWLSVVSILLLLMLAACGSDDAESTTDTHDHDASVVQASDAEGTSGEGQQLWTCGMHPQIVSEEPGQCPICGMDLTPMKQSGSSEGVVEIDPVTIQNMGVRTALAEVTSLARTIRTTGRFVMDEQGEHTVSMKIGGWVEELYANFDGQIIRKGEPLLEIYSPELVSTQEEYLLAFRNAERLEGTSAADDAQRLLEAARRRLAYWDLSEAQIRQLEETGTPRRAVPFYAPRSGEIMRKQVVEGEYVRAGQPLMDIVDISKIWLIVDVYEQDLGWIREGTPARIELPYQPGVTYEGRVHHIYHMLDTDTRSAKARIELPGGHQGPFKPGMYATVHLVGRETEPAPVVPVEAVLQSGDGEIVVLALGEGRFRPVPVEAGVEADGKVQILAGLEGGERVVTSAQFLIDSEARLKSAVGAMMAGHDHGGAGAMDEGRMPDASGGGGASDAVSAGQHGGVQQVTITIGEDGRFSPARIALTEGVPAELTFERHTDETCATDVQIPAFGVEATPLPLHEAVTIRFTPDESGSFTFACGMDMIKGTLLVKS